MPVICGFAKYAEFILQENNELHIQKFRPDDTIRQKPIEQINLGKLTQKDVDSMIYSLNQIRPFLPEKLHD